jgi:hypothetical protein
VLEKIDVLEDLCTLLLKGAFMGLRPKNNVSTNLSRFGGATLTQLNSSKKHVLFMPNSAAARDSAEERFDPAKMSLFVNQWACANTFEPEIVDKLIRVMKIRLPGNASYQCKLSALTSSHKLFKEIVPQAQNLLVSEFTEPLPIAKLNCFKVYELALQVWKEIAVKFTVPDGSGIPPQFKLSSSLQSDLPCAVLSGMYYGVRSALHVSQEMKRVKKSADWEKFVSLRVMRDAIVGVWGEKVSAEFV